MKIRILTHLSGPTDRYAGDEAEYPDAEAERLIEAGHAEAIDDEDPPARPAKNKKTK